MKRLTLQPLLLSLSFAQKNARFDSLYRSLFKADKFNELASVSKQFTAVNQDITFFSN